MNLKCYLLSLLRIQHPDCARCNARQTYDILLEGYRGSRPSDTNALVGILITISRLMAAGRIREIDLNPVAVYPAGALILDVKMSLL